MSTPDLFNSLDGRKLEEMKISKSRNEKSKNESFQFSEYIPSFGTVIHYAPYFILIKISIVMVISIVLYLSTQDNHGNRYVHQNTFNTQTNLEYNTFSTRPVGLRSLIRETSFKADRLHSLVTLVSFVELEYDGLIEFIISRPTVDSSQNIAAKSRAISTLSTDESTQIKTFNDPLDVSIIEKSLIIHRFTNSSGEPFTIALNKFNSVKDHSLLLTDEFSPQIAPLTPHELVLWHWILGEIRGVGFFNSNLLAGASQPHRHMQFLPLDELWHLRNVDSPHALPISDVILPRIESGEWNLFPMRAHTRNNKMGDINLKDYIHMLPQFDFIHGVAALHGRSNLLRQGYGGPSEIEYAEYLYDVYYHLMEKVGISLELLNKCANNSADPSECLYNGAYNLILTQEFMMVVPRSKGNFEGIVSVNSFGFLGMLLAPTVEAYEAIKHHGPLSILKAVTKPIS